MERRFTNNNVRILRRQGRYAVVNEGGDVLSTSAVRSRLYTWCRKNRCQPTKADWTELEDKWSILHWYKVTRNTIPNRPACAADAKTVLMCRGGAIMAALYVYKGNPNISGWRLFVRNSARSELYNAVTAAFGPSAKWKLNQVTYWAEMEMRIGQDRPADVDEVQKLHDRRSRVLEQAGY